MMLDKTFAPGLGNHKTRGRFGCRLPHTNRLAGEQHTGTDR